MQWSNLLTALPTEDPGTEALCSLAGKGLCKGWGTQWVCVSCPHTEEIHEHYHALISTLMCFLLCSIHPYVPSEWWHTWLFRGCLAPPRAPGQRQPPAPLLSNGELLVVWIERSIKVAPSRPLVVTVRRSCCARSPSPEAWTETAGISLYPPFETDPNPQPLLGFL